MLVEHLQLFEIQIALFEFDPLLVVLMHQALFLAADLHVDLSLLVHLLKLFSHACFLLLDVLLDFANFFADPRGRDTTEA